MKRIGDKLYYGKKDVATIVDKSTQTIHLWTRWSDELEAEGKERLIPKPVRFDNDYRYWTEEDLEKIKEFADWLRCNKGALSEFSKRQYDTEERKKFNESRKC